MIMKKVFVLSLLATAALSACQKNAVVVEEGIPMSISVSWNDVTKTYLKSTGKQIDSFWDGKETISIISLGEKKDLIAVDNFTCDAVSGAETAVFKGKFTGREPYYIKVMYPALLNEKIINTPYYTGKEGSMSLLTLQDQYTFISQITPLVQCGDFDLQHFNNYCLAVGDAGLKAADSGVLVMKSPLQNLSTVLKFELKFPEKYWGATMDGLTLSCNDAKGNPKDIFAYGEEKQAVGAILNDRIFKGAASNGSAVNKLTLFTKLEVPKGGDVTLFLPVYLIENCADAGDVWHFDVTIDGTGYDLGKKEFKEDTKLVPGNMYRIQIDASAEGVPAPGWSDGGEVPLS